LFCKGLGGWQKYSRLVLLIVEFACACSRRTKPSRKCGLPDLVQSRATAPNCSDEGWRKSFGLENRLQRLWTKFELATNPSASAVVSGSAHQDTARFSPVGAAVAAADTTRACRNNSWVFIFFSDWKQQHE
jgi:hypothetical protein